MLSDYMGRSLLEQRSHLHSRLAAAEMLQMLPNLLLAQLLSEYKRQHLFLAYD